MKLISVGSTVERASNLLKEVNLIYGLVSGVMLKFAFDWSSQTAKYDKTRSWLAVGLSLGSLTFAGVLVTLMGNVAVESLTNEGSVEPTLVVYMMVFVVIIVLLAISVMALVRSLLHLRRVRAGLKS
jgi:F0F1-type ATP synthase membrane subunit c/vacuolar-type H+-ATPase subunit K